MSITQKVVPPPNSGDMGLQSFTQAINLAVQPLFQDAHTHTIYSSTPTNNAGANNDIALVALASGKFLYAKINGTWYSVALAGNATPTTTATALATATGSVIVSGAAAPSAGQVLTATSSTAADWQTPASPPSLPDFVIRETPTGAVNGINATFTLAFTPTLGTEEIFVNGILQDSGVSNDYTIVGPTITFNTPAIPQTGDKVRVSYQHT